VQKVFDALSNDDNRRIYDRFGEDFFNKPGHDRWLESPTSIAFMYLPVWGPPFCPRSPLSSQQIKLVRCRWFAAAL